jgi:hypothetical protein
MYMNGKSKLAWKFVVGIDLFLVFSSFLLIHVYDKPHLWRYLWRFLVPFNLGGEMNISVWWSGITLALAGFIAYEIFCDDASRSRSAWLVLSVILLGLSIDEICSIHERIDKTTLFGSILLLLFAYSFVKLLMDGGTRGSAKLIFTGFLCYGLTVGQEHLEHAITWPHWLLGIRVALEEGTELLGTLLILLGVVPNRKTDLPTSSLPSVAPLVPNPSNFKGLRAFLFIGTGLGAAVSLLVFPLLADVGKQGNPSVWYPSILYLLVSCALFWEAQKTTSSQNAMPYSLSILFLLSSIYCVYPLYKLFPEIEGIVPTRVLLYSGIYFIQLAGIWVFHKKHKQLSAGQRNIFTAFAALAILSLFFRDTSIKLLMLSLASFCTASIFLKGEEEAKSRIRVAM